MKVKLHLKERFYLGNILPQENTLVNYQLKKRILEKVNVTEEDKEKLGFKVSDDGNGAEWDAKKDFENPKEIDFSEDERKYIQESIEKLSDGTHPDEYWVVVGTIYDKISVHL